MNMNTLPHSKKRACAVVAKAYIIFSATQIFAANDNVGTLAMYITNSFQGLTQLIIGIAYVAGLGFGLASLFKFKQHKDNPTQVPIGTPVSMLMISAALVFLPQLYTPLGATIFGTSATLYGGGTEGTGATAIPGFGSATT